MAVWRKIWVKAKDNAVVRRRGAEALGILCWLLLSADEQGVVRCSVAEAERMLCLPRMKMWRTLEAFEEDGTLEVKGVRGHSVEITLKKWAKYARQDNEENKTKRRSVRQKLFKRDATVIDKSRNDKELGDVGEFNRDSTVIQTVIPDENPTPPNSRLSSELATTEKTASRARLEEEDIYKYYTTPYARAREETPVEKLEKEDREEAARLRETIRYPTKWEEVRDAAVAYAISMDEEEADGFLAKYASVGWVKAGAKIRDWRYLLQSWHRNWQQVEKDNTARRTNGNRCNDRGNPGSAGSDCWGQAKFSGKYGAATTEEEARRMFDAHATDGD